MENLDTETVRDLAKQALFKVRGKSESDEECSRIEIIIKRKSLNVDQVNELLSFTFKHRYSVLQPKTVRSMINDIFEAINHPGRKESFTANVSRSDLEIIHEYIMANRK